MNKRVVYTAITNGYDQLKDPPFTTPGWDYVVFTNGNGKINSAVWRPRKIPEALMRYDPIRQARLLKISPNLFLPEYDLSLWHDGNIECRTHLNEFLETMLGKEIGKGRSMALVSHPDRTCTFDEADACIKLRKDNPDIIAAQTERYRHWNFPENAGMVATGVMIRAHHDKRLVVFNEYWANEVIHWSVRDQISFNFLAWKLELSFVTMPWKVIFQYFDKQNHKRDARFSHN